MIGNGVHRRVRGLLVVLSAALVMMDAVFLFQTPVVGVPDNGDSWRVMVPAGIEYSSPASSTREPAIFPGGQGSARSAVEQRYVTRSPRPSFLPSSAALAALLSRGIPFAAAGELDLRQVGVTYLVLLALSLPLAWGGRWDCCAYAALALWVVSDPGYLLYFNSFYADPAMIVGIAGIVFWLLRGGEEQRSRLRLGLSSALLALLTGMVAFTKLSYSVLGAVAAGAALVVARCDGSLRDPIVRVTIGALLAIGVVAPAHFQWGSGFRAPEINRYNAVFHGVAVASKNPDRVLSELGLSDHRPLVGSYYFTDGLTKAERHAAASVPLSGIVSAYLREPATLVAAARRSAAALSRPWASARERMGAGMDRRASRSPLRFGFWRSFLLGSAWKVVLWSVASIAFVAASIARRKLDPPVIAVGFLVVVIAAQIVVTIVGDGFFAIGRHLLAARLGLDLCVVILLFAASSAAVRAAMAARGASRAVSFTPTSSPPAP
jgi:hypothetical protein